MIPTNQFQPSENNSPILSNQPNQSPSIGSFLSRKNDSKCNSFKSHTSSSRRSNSSSSKAQNIQYRSPSYFLDFGNDQAVSPSLPGSTYTVKRVNISGSIAQSRREISRFDDETVSRKSSTSKILHGKNASSIVCKVEEPADEIEIDEVMSQQQFSKMKTRAQGRKNKEDKNKEEVISKEQEIKLKTEGQSKQGDRIKCVKIKRGRKPKNQGLVPPVVEAKEQNQEQPGKIEDVVEEEVSIMPSKEEDSKENQNNLEISDVFENFEIESDSQETERELLTETETLEALKPNWGGKMHPLSFLSEEEKNEEIYQKCVFNNDGIRFEGKDELLFLSQANLKGGKILSLYSELLHIPTQTFKRISKISVESYRCKYCGRFFDKGCALGGHISRIHKGESEDFKYRLKSITKRVSDRTRGKILRKESMKQLHGGDVLKQK